MTQHTQGEWGAETWHKPTLGESETEIYSEHGRVLLDEKLNLNVCYRSHWFVVTKARFGGYHLLVKHGGGQERLNLGSHALVIDQWSLMSSDARFLMFWAMFDIKHEAESQMYHKTSNDYAIAFIDGRLKKRRKNGRTRVEIAQKENA